MNLTITQQIRLCIIISIGVVILQFGVMSFCAGLPVGIFSALYTAALANYLIGKMSKMSWGLKFRQTPQE